MLTFKELAYYFSQNLWQFKQKRSKVLVDFFCFGLNRKQKKSVNVNALLPFIQLFAK